jgi:hypothetical protein
MRAAFAITAQRSIEKSKPPVAPGGETLITGRAPLLSVLFLDVNTGFAVGGYSLFLGTHLMAARPGHRST